MNPVALAFTLAAAVAVLVHGFYLGRLYGDWRALVENKQNGILRKISRSFIQVEATRYAMNMLMLLSGLSVLLAASFHGELYQVLRDGAYLLALIPFVSTISTFFALRGFD